MKLEIKPQGKVCLPGEILTVARAKHGLLLEVKSFFFAGSTKRKPWPAKT